MSGSSLPGGVIGPREGEELWLAALAGVPELALEFERLGIAGEDGDESLKLAKQWRPYLLALADALLNDPGIREILEKRGEDQDGALDGG